MASNLIPCLKIVKDNSHVFINVSVVNSAQLKQLMDNPSVALERSQRVEERVIPKIKIRNLCPPNTQKRSNTTKCDNKRLAFKCVNDTNDANVALNCLTEDIKTTNRPKRKLRSNCRPNDKKPKSDSKPIDEKSLKVNTSDGNQKKNKENNYSCNAEMSRMIGLPNMGNTCYINSIIQVLRMTPGFRQFICSLNNTIDCHKNSSKLKESNKQLISSLHNIFVHFGENGANFDKTSLSANESKITDLIECEDIKHRFEFGQQHDCHEFLNWLINELNSFAELIFPNRKNVAKNSYNTRRKNCHTFQSFQGVMSMNIECSECRKCSSINDSFADIQIPLCISEETTDISNAQTFTEIIHKKYYLKDEDMFECRNCSKKTNASVVNSIEIPPKTLIIYIKTPFEYNQKITRNANPKKKLFKVPLSLEYSASKTPSHSIHYSLYGFIMHSGSDIDNGHYFAVIDSGPPNPKYKKKNECICAPNVLANNGWIKVNDHSVHKMSVTHLKKFLENDNISSTPYLAFYQRID